MPDAPTLLDRIASARSFDDLGPIYRTMESASFKKLHELDQSRVWEAYRAKLNEVVRMVGAG